ncbi:MAG: DUF4405 domain-containing protein [Phycisphaerae bacterium]|nr:DUF4405 domain-containing protein [Phycisphaerae bacterium]
MAQTKQTRFNWRGFTSITTALSFLGLACTGVVLFFMPPGRIANWTGWTCAGLTKHQWGGLHIWFGILFAVICIIHAIYNWKCLLNYFKDKTRQHFALRWEWALALALCGLLLMGTIRDTTPFSTLLAWQESVKSSYDRLPAQAPIAHAELLTLDQLAKQIDGVEAAGLETNLEANSITLTSPEETIGELAQRYGKTPSEIYQLALGNTSTTQTHLGGQGRGGYGGGGGGQRFGQMTLKDFCEQAGLDMVTAMEKLNQAGCTASDSMTMRDIASTAGLHPSELRSLLE